MKTSQYPDKVNNLGSIDKMTEIYQIYTEYTKTLTVQG